MDELTSLAVLPAAILRAKKAFGHYMDGHRPLGAHLLTDLTSMRPDTLGGESTAPGVQS